jgi:stalled ribosome rescue protein Dom34
VNYENFIIDKRSERQMSINLIDQLQQSVSVVPILLVNFSREPIAMIHHSVFVIATIQHHTAGKDDETGEKDEQNFQAFLSSVDKVAVEDVAVCVRW